MSQATLLKLLAGEGKGMRFASLVYRSIGTNELAKLTILLGFSTEEVYKQDVEMLETLKYQTEKEIEKFQMEQECEYVPTDMALKMEAICAILSSRKESLTVGIGNNSQYTCRETYYHFDDLPGIRVHKDTGEMYVNGLVQNKVVLEEGEYKEVKSKPLTLAKKKIEKSLPSSKFRLYKLPNVNGIKCDGQTLILE